MVVKCPSCGQQVRGEPGQSGPCPKCGVRLKFPEGDNNIGEQVTCPQCGQKQPYNNGRCINCGKPLNGQVEDVGNSQVKPKKKGKKKLVSLIVVLLLAVAGGVYFFTLNQKKEYIDNLHSFQLSVVLGGTKAEDLCNLTRQVWYDAIFEEYSAETEKYTHNEFGRYVYDFNDALIALSADEDIQSQKGLISTYQDTARETMAELTNPPSGLDECYTVALDLYSEFNKLCNLAVSPSGSLQSYTDEINECDSEVGDLFERFSLIVPDRITYPWENTATEA